MRNVSSSPQNNKISEQQSITASPVASLEPLLEISKRRPDRIIFMGKEAKITAKGFSLLYFLAQHKQEVVSYDSILDEIWKDDEDAIYTRIISHIYKFRSKILDAIGHNEDNKEKVKDIFKVISGRGVMLNINDEELQIINP
jgi:helicase